MACKQKNNLIAYSCALIFGAAIMAFPSSLSDLEHDFSRAELAEDIMLKPVDDINNEPPQAETPIKNSVPISKDKTPESDKKLRLDYTPKIDLTQEKPQHAPKQKKLAELHLPVIKQMAEPLSKKVSTSKIYPRVRARSRGIFNTLELEFNDSEKIRSWAAVKPALLQDQRSFKSCIDQDRNCGFDNLSQWARDIRYLKNYPLKDLVLHVNMRVNKLNYQSDVARYSNSDKWLAPREFLQIGGDCEDFVLLKMASLSALGVPDDNMRIVVGILDDGRAHAVLNVNLHGQDIILDNRKSEILVADVSDFSPKYSMNFKKRWTHIERKPAVLYAHNIAR